MDWTRKRARKGANDDYTGGGKKVLAREDWPERLGAKASIKLDSTKRIGQQMVCPKGVA